MGSEYTEYAAGAATSLVDTLQHSWPLAQSVEQDSMYPHIVRVNTSDGRVLVLVVNEHVSDGPNKARERIWRSQAPPGDFMARDTF